MEDPITKFKSWWNDALSESTLNQKSAACLSTITKDGFPSGRFVDLKDVGDNGFTFCTTLDSPKGKQIADNSKVALTIWWDYVGYQVRIIGNAVMISESDSEKYWMKRSREAQLTTTASNQSHMLKSEKALVSELEKIQSKFRGQAIPKPNNWGGYIVKPVSIEFLKFVKNRLHKRERFKRKDNSAWSMTRLQP